MRPLPLSIECTRDKLFWMVTVLDAKGQPVFILQAGSEQQLQELRWVVNCVNDQQDILKLKNGYEAEVERLNKSLKFARDMAIRKSKENAALKDALRDVRYLYCSMECKCCNRMKDIAEKVLTPSEPSEDEEYHHGPECPSLTVQGAVQNHGDIVEVYGKCDCKFPAPEPSGKERYVQPIPPIDDNPGFKCEDAPLPPAPDAGGELRKTLIEAVKIWFDYDLTENPQTLEGMFEALYFLLQPTREGLSEKNCANCDGTGYLFKYKDTACDTCNGHGKVWVKK